MFCHPISSLHFPLSVPFDYCTESEYILFACVRKQKQALGLLLMLAMPLAGAGASTQKRKQKLLGSNFFDFPPVSFRTPTSATDGTKQAIYSLRRRF